MTFIYTNTRFKYTIIICSENCPLVDVEIYKCILGRMRPSSGWLVKTIDKMHESSSSSWSSLSAVPLDTCVPRRVRMSASSSTLLQELLFLQARSRGAKGSGYWSTGGISSPSSRAKGTIARPAIDCTKTRKTSEKGVGGLGVSRSRNVNLAGDVRWSFECRSQFCRTLKENMCVK